MDSEDKDNREEVIKKIKELPAKERVKAVALNYWLEKKKKLDDELEAKIQSLQHDYDLKSLPIFATQGEIIQGTRLPNEDELKNQDKYLEDSEKVQATEAGHEAGIKDYWEKVFKNSDIIGQATGDNKEDEKIFEHLKNVELEFDKDSIKNFTVILTFGDNEWFTNTVLKKTFIYDEKDELAEEPVKTIGTKIEWKEGKNITQKTVEKKQKNKKTGAVRKVKKHVHCDSFFWFFESTDQQEIEDAEDEEGEKLEDQFNLDYDVGRNFVEEIVPFSLELYLGIKPSFDHDDEDFEDEDEEEDDDEDDEDDGKKKKKGKKPRKKSGESGDSKKSGDKKKEETKPAGKDECKQQ